MTDLELSVTNKSSFLPLNDCSKLDVITAGDLWN